MNMLKFKNSLKTTTASIRWKIEGFKKDVEAVAAIEFAFLAPLMLLMYVGTIEVSSAVSANRKLSRSASAIGDLITQVDGTCIEDATMNDIVKIADSIMKPYDDGFKIVVTAIEVEASGENDIIWSKPYGGAVAETVGETYTLPSQIASSEGFIIAAKLTKSYTPAFGWANFSNHSITFDNSAIDMEEELFLRPRVGSFIDSEATCS